VSRGGGLRPDLNKLQIQMDAAPDGTVLIDVNGHAWQKSSYVGYWYRAYESDRPSSSFELAQNAGPKPMIIKPPASTTGSDQ